MAGIWTDGVPRFPVHLQLMQEIRHGVETGALQAGERLPTIHGLAEERVIDPKLP